MFNCFQICCRLSHFADPPFISLWFILLDEPVSKCVLLRFPTRVRSVIPRKGAPKPLWSMIRLSVLLRGLWYDFFGFAHESTEPCAARLTVYTHTHPHTHNPSPLPSFSLALSSFVRFSFRLVRLFLRLVSLPLSQGLSSQVKG